MAERSPTKLVLPRKIYWEEDSLSPTYGKLRVEPLERGYGITLGNALRRVLLSSIPGAAIVAVKIEGVQHEYSTIPGVLEDVTDIILNLKKVRLKMIGEEPKWMYVKAKGECEIKAGDIEHDATITILNPEHHIATLGKGAKLNMELLVKKGRGYMTSDELSEQEPDQVGLIFIDALFSPIEKVNFTVNLARIGHESKYDRLTLEVYTDGSITPQDAVSVAARILQNQLEPFVHFSSEEDSTEQTVSPEVNKLNDHLEQSVEELDISVRALNCLKKAKIRTVRDLVQKTEKELLSNKNFGKRSLEEIVQVLESMGLSLGMSPEELPPPPVAGPMNIVKGG